MKTFKLCIVTAKVTPVEVVGFHTVVGDEIVVNILVPRELPEELRVAAFIDTADNKVYGYAKTSGDATLIDAPYVMCNITCPNSDKATICYKYKGKYYLDMFKLKDGARYLRHELNLDILDTLEELF